MNKMNGLLDGLGGYDRGADVMVDGYDRRDGSNGCSGTVAYLPLFLISDGVDLDHRLPCS